MIFKAIVKDKLTGKRKIIESDSPTKADFVHDCRRNGYAVDVRKVKYAALFDYIMENTDCNPWDWDLWKIPE